MSGFLYHLACHIIKKSQIVANRVDMYINNQLKYICMINDYKSMCMDANILCTCVNIHRQTNESSMQTNVIDSLHKCCQTEDRYVIIIKLFINITTTTYLEDMRKQSVIVGMVKTHGSVLHRVSMSCRGSTDRKKETQFL